MKTDLVVALADRFYSVERPWGNLPQGMQIQTVGHVAVDSDDNVYLFHRGKPPVIVFDPGGNYLRSWGTDELADAHGMYITRDDQVLLVDRDAHQILCFDTRGKLAWTIGERHRPRLQAPFNHPTDVALAPNGDVYVCDGYANSVVHRFSSEGTWKQTWGRPGTGPGEFTTPHAIWVDQADRVLVADRENNRIQLFTLDGEYLLEWGDFYHPMDIYVDPEGAIYVTDQIPRLSMLSPSGDLIGRCRPVLNGAHSVWGDSRGNLYLAEVRPNDRLTKLTRRGSG